MLREKININSFEDFDKMSVEDQNKKFLVVKKEFDKLVDLRVSDAKAVFAELLEEAVLLAVEGNVVAQDFLTFIYKKGRTGNLEPNLLRAYEWGIIAAANGSKLSVDRLKFFFTPAYNEIVQSPKLDQILNEYDLDKDNVEHFFGSALSDMITSCSWVNVQELSKMPIYPEKYSEEKLRELERIRDRVIQSTLELL